MSFSSYSSYCNRAITVFIFSNYSYLLYIIVTIVSSAINLVIYYIL